MEKSSYRTPLSRARGLGSAHAGVSGFIRERVTSIALIPLCLWAIWAAIRVGPGGYVAAAAFLQSPINAGLAVLLIGVSAVHMQLGMRVVVEDYIHGPGRKITLLLLNAGVCWLAGALGIVSILKVALIGAGAH